MTVDHFLIDVFVLSITTSQQQNLAYSRSFSLTIYIVAEIDTISKWIKVKYVLRRVTKWNLKFFGTISLCWAYLFGKNAWSYFVHLIWNVYPLYTGKELLIKRLIIFLRSSSSIFCNEASEIILQIAILDVWILINPNCIWLSCAHLWMWKIESW